MVKNIKSIQSRPVGYESTSQYKCPKSLRNEKQQQTVRWAWPWTSGYSFSFFSLLSADQSPLSAPLPGAFPIYLFMLSICPLLPGSSRWIATSPLRCPEVPIWEAMDALSTREGSGSSGWVAWNQTVHVSAARWNNREVRGYRLTKGSVSMSGLVEPWGVEPQSHSGSRGRRSGRRSLVCFIFVCD